MSKTPAPPPAFPVLPGKEAPSDHPLAHRRGETYRQPEEDAKRGPLKEGAIYNTPEGPRTVRGGELLTPEVAEAYDAPAPEVLEKELEAKEPSPSEGLSPDAPKRGKK